MNKAEIGLIGLAVMGENLVMNMESKGFTTEEQKAKKLSDAEVWRNWFRHWKNREKS